MQKENAPSLSDICALVVEAEARFDRAKAELSARKDTLAELLRDELASFRSGGALSGALKEIPGYKIGVKISKTVAWDSNILADVLASFPPGNTIEVKKTLAIPERELTRLASISPGTVESLCKARSVKYGEPSVTVTPTE